MTTPKWTFKSHFRRNAYGWNGTAAATKRLKEAVSEIKKVARKDPVTAAEGTVSLVERIWPALESIDGSSGSLGNAVYRTLVALIPILIKAPAEAEARSAWLERLYEAIQEDGVDYLLPIGEQWGAICGNRDVASEWADRLMPAVRESWTNPDAWHRVEGCTMCLSSLVAAERYEDLQELLSLRKIRFWPDDKFWAEVLVQQGNIDEAIAFAEQGRKDRPGYYDAVIAEFCEQTLLDAGRQEEAYERYALQAVRATTKLAIFRQLTKKYSDRDRRGILLDLIEAGDRKGKWFSAAKTAECWDIALACAADEWADPATLIRAARDFEEKDPAFAAEVARCAIKHLLDGGGYEPTTFDLATAYSFLRSASERCGRSDWATTEIDRLIDHGASAGRQPFLRALIAEREQETK